MRALALLTLLLVVAACTPAASPVAERAGTDVTITVRANQDLYDVMLVALNATSEDERCIPQEDGADIVCHLGDVEGGGSVRVQATSVGELHCAAWAYVRPPGETRILRPFGCRSG